MPNKIIIVRHGETSYNVERRLQGWTDIPLNKNGREQAGKVALRLSSESVTAIYSSDHRRAHSTARSIGKKLNLIPRKRSALREDRLGILEGWRWEVEIDPMRQKLWEERDASRARGELHWDKHGGDSLHSHTTRVKKFLDKIESIHTEDTVVIVSHGGTINRIMEIYGFKKITDDYISYKNTSVTVLRKKDSGYELEIDNDISHL